jgi:hypothetical protein
MLAVDLIRRIDLEVDAGEVPRRRRLIRSLIRLSSRTSSETYREHISQVATAPVLT